MKRKTAEVVMQGNYTCWGWILLALSALAAAQLFGVSVAAAAAESEQVTDQAISDAVENELLFDQAVSVNNIDITVNQGIVTLTGSVNNVLAKERAERLAETVKGIRAVVNRISVDPYWGRMDWRIERDAEEALLYDPATEATEIDVSVEDNIAALSGTADSWQERQIAETVVKGVRGVKDVVNDIVVDVKHTRADSEIRSEVEQALRRDALVDDGLISVRVENGEVQLSGTAGSAAEKRQARYDGWVAGVKSVDASELEVARWARDDDLRKDKYVYKSDEELAEAVEDALLYDPRVASFKVDADVSAGVVTLRGTVDNLKAKNAAERDARNVVGVVSVVNRLRIRPAVTLSDVEMAENIRDALARDPYVERHEVTVSVIDGTVYLSGTVDSYFEKGRAGDIASRAAGVVKVNNNLAVNFPAYPLTYSPYVYDYYAYGPWYDYEPRVTFRTDAEIKASIESELFWSPFVDSDDVNVTVDNGVATLTGIVDSWSERQAATENALEGGAIRVDNDLMIEVQ